MKDDKCTKRYHVLFRQEMLRDENEYPKYRR